MYLDLVLLERRLGSPIESSLDAVMHSLMVYSIFYLYSNGIGPHLHKKPHYIYLKIEIFPFSLFYKRFCIYCYSVDKSCPTFGDPMNCSPPSPSLRGVSQAGIME